MQACSIKPLYTEAERKLYDMARFEFQALQNAMDQFLSRTDFEYSEEHVRRLFDEYTLSYTKLQLLEQELDRLHAQSDS